MPRSRHTVQQLDQLAAFHELDRLVAREVDSIGRVATARHKDGAVGFVANHRAIQFAHQLYPHCARLPALALHHERFVVCAKFEVDPAVSGGTTALGDAIALPAVCLADELLELLP